jgi:hypothetical protein
MYSADMYVTHFDHGLMWSYVRARDGEVTAGERAAISCAWLELSVGWLLEVDVGEAGLEVLGGVPTGFTGSILGSWLHVG